MEEELLDYLFQWAQSDGFKKSKDDFANLIKTNDEVFNYAYKFAEADGYKKGPDAFGKLLGRGISNKEEVIEKKPVENINVEEKSISSIPKKDSEVKSPPSIPVEMSGITPVTEKTEVKSVDTPSDKMVIKSEKKEEQPPKEMTVKEKEEWECPPAQGGCPKNKNVVQDYIYEKYEKDGDKRVMSIVDREGNLARFIDGTGEDIPGILKEYKHSKYNRNNKMFTYSAEEPPKSKRFSVYNVPIDGVETSVIYDNKTGVILKDTKDIITSEDGKPIKTWMDVPIMYDEYKTLKAEIDKAKVGTTAPKINTVPELEPWQQPQSKVEVKEVTKDEPKMVIKSEKKEEVNQKTPIFSKPIIINGAKFDDDMNLMRTFKPIEFEEYKELSKLAKPVDKSLDEIAQSFVKDSESIQLDRNISLSFPDPPNAKKKSVVTQNTENIFEDKIDNKNVYSYYDEKNKKWYIYNKEKDENNWNEVTSPQIKTVLNAKYKNNSGEIDKSKIFKTEEAEAEKIIKIKDYYYYNKYLPTLIENWDNLKEDQKDSIKKDLNVLLMKRLSRDMYWKEKYKEEINDVKERIKRNETVDEIDMNVLKFGNPDERYDKFWEYVVEKTGVGDEQVKALIKKYKK